MSNQRKSTNGITFNVSNKPGFNGAPEKEWENAGQLFVDLDDKRGTLYLNLTVDQLQAFLKLAKANGGKLEKKFSLFPRKPKASSDKPADAAAAA